MNCENVAEIVSSSEEVKQPQPIAAILQPLPPPLSNPNRPPTTSHYSEARFLYKFLYLRNREDIMTTHFQRQTHIDKFCSFHVSLGSFDCTMFVVHLPMRGRPSVFKALPQDGLIEGPLPLPTKLKDFAKFYQHEPGYKLHEDNSEFKTPIPVETIHDFLMERIINRTCTLAEMFLDAHRDVNIQLRSYILNNFDYYSHEEKVTRQLEEFHQLDRYNSDALQEIAREYKRQLLSSQKDNSGKISRRPAQRNRSSRRARQEEEEEEEEEGEDLVDDDDDSDDDVDADMDEDVNDFLDDNDDDNDGDAGGPQGDRQQGTKGVTQHRSKPTTRPKNQPQKTIEKKTKKSIPVKRRTSKSKPQTQQQKNPLPLKVKKFQVIATPLQQAVMRPNPEAQVRGQPNLPTNKKATSPKQTVDPAGQEIARKEVPRKQHKKSSIT